MNRDDLQQLSQIREMEAVVLLEVGRFCGAYYLMGYAIECALKACIAKRVREFDFPDKNTVIDSYTHNLENLLKVAGLSEEFRQHSALRADLERNWRVVVDWNEATRYKLDTTEEEAENLHVACRADIDGVLPWIRERW